MVKNFVFSFISKHLSAVDSDRICWWKTEGQNNFEKSSFVPFSPESPLLMIHVNLYFVFAGWAFGKLCVSKFTSQCWQKV